MKKLLIAFALAGSASTAMANSNIGCGLGTEIFKGKSGLAPQLLASTTNGIFTNQWIGITFGLFGCSQNGVVGGDVRINEFLGVNSENLARDIAMGQGETLDTFSNLVGVPQERKTEFNQLAKANFSTIFNEENKTAGDILTAIRNVVVSHTLATANTVG